ncbi:hypothetical protein L873DRAFT_1802276 [Choiromyces venosus 120613-1]|uniref:Uncharacterized protein n=1 Tax=Choiromyces venosus 120613-1 TaxID=1336337 RepID=A0A3N4JVG7_9PEZI|nr:hypothetical protein L873DRAFT_1802276 [Choiromyces venosus 120613-1]
MCSVFHSACLVAPLPSSFLSLVVTLSHLRRRLPFLPLLFPHPTNTTITAPAPNPPYPSLLLKTSLVTFSSTASSSSSTYLRSTVPPAAFLSPPSL